MSVNVRRQDFSPIYLVNGAIYIQKNDEYLDLDIATYYLKKMKDEKI